LKWKANFGGNYYQAVTSNPHVQLHICQHTPIHHQSHTNDHRNSMYIRHEW